MMAVCPDCGAALRQDVADDYVACPVCGTFVLQARTTAEAENAAFFDEHYRPINAARIDERKRKLFQQAEDRDQAARAAEQLSFQHNIQRIQALLLRPGQRVLEVGFGDGVSLARLLQAGVDAWGEDLSQTVIENFQRQFPAHAGRVAQPGATPGAFDLLYGSALFEHLDEPRAFLRAARQRLQAGGVLILDHSPLAMPGQADLTPAEDICFWKPCHRVLHSRTGLLRLAAQTGFAVEALAAMDSFTYRVLSLHRRAGYPAIETIRNACLMDPRLPGLWRYRWLCWRARHIRSRCHAASAILRAATADNGEGVAVP